MSHQGGEEGGGDGGEAVADDETHDGEGPLRYPAVLDGQQAGQVGDRVVGAARRQSQQAEEADSENVTGEAGSDQSQQDRDQAGAQVAQEVDQVGPEDGRLPAKPVVTESPYKAAQYIASPENCLNQCGDPVQLLHPVVLQWGDDGLDTLLLMAGLTSLTRVGKTVE